MDDVKPYHLVTVTIYGDEWERSVYHVVRTEKETNYFLTEYKEKELKVGGVCDVSVDVEYNISFTSLYLILTVGDLLESIPELEEIIESKLKNYTGGFVNEEL